jgi:hypothetical protein
VPHLLSDLIVPLAHVTRREIPASEEAGYSDPISPAMML